MKCPKCGYNSFDYLASCKKCGNDLEGFKSRFNLRSLIFPGREMVAPVMGESLGGDALGGAEESVADATDFGFDFNEDESPVGASAPALEEPAAAAALEEEGFDIDWNETDSEEFDLDADENPSPEPSQPTASGRDFDFETDDELDDLLQDEPTVGTTEVPSGPQGLAWEEEPLPDLSLSEEEAPALDALDDEGLSVDEVAEAGGDTGAVGVEELPGLDELDFEELGDGEAELVEEPEADAEAAWGEIDFGDEAEAEPGEKKKKGAEENPRDPFDQPEPVAGEQAPESCATMAAGQLDLPWSAAEERQRAGEESGDAAPPPSSLTEEPVPAPAPPTAPMAAAQEPSPALAMAAEETSAAGEPSLPASLLARFGAFCLDLFLISGVFLLFLVCGTRLLAAPGDTALLPSVQALLDLSIPYYLILFTVCFLYFTAFHFFLGQTPGKMLFALRVESREGGALLFSEAFLHTVGGLVSLLVFGAGFFIAYFDGQGRGWNDRIAGTRVVAELGEV